MFVEALIPISRVINFYEDDRRYCAEPHEQIPLFLSPNDAVYILTKPIFLPNIFHQSVPLSTPDDELTEPTESKRISLSLLPTNPPCPYHSLRLCSHRFSFRCVDVARTMTTTTVERKRGTLCWPGILAAWLPENTHKFNNVRINKTLQRALDSEMAEGRGSSRG